MNYNPAQYLRSKNRLQRRYVSRLNKALKSIKQFSYSKTNLWLKDHHSTLKEYSPLNWYFIQQVEALIFFLEPMNDDQEGEFSEEQDYIFEQWNQSEFADIFLKALNARMTIPEASDKTAKFFDEHLVSLGNRHLLKSHKAHKNYRLQPSLGDYLKNKTLSKLLETTLHLEGKDLVLMTKSMKEMKDFSARIEDALNIIRTFSPESWDRFKAYTEVIVPINQPELVSYSHQELPGTSMINLYNRDFVDLMDDLLHENGHHHLNYYLNLEELIQEPQDLIYYSPWRRTLRPLRGIYHAYFTFFWAFKIFSDLNNQKDLENDWYGFNAKEKDRMLWRAIEEYWMLEYSFVDLKWAHEQGLISENGWKLVKEQREQLLTFKKKIPVWEKALKSHKKELTGLKKTLSEARKKYKK